MGNVKGFKVAALAASIAFAMGSSAVMAAAPTAGQLPGKGTLVSEGAAPVVTITDGKMDVALNSLAVIDWNKGDINKDGVAGFNIGSKAEVNFTGNWAVLNIDSTGNPSQIFGALTSEANVFVANTNGIIVGTGASISGPGVALIANKLGGLDTFEDYGTFDSLAYDGTGGDVTVQHGASVNGNIAVLVAGGSNVNVDLGNVTGGYVRLTAGLPVGGENFTSKNPSANLAVTGGVTDGVTDGANITQFASAGTATTNGTLNLSGVTTDVAGLLTNNGDLTVARALGAVHNQGKLTNAGSATFSSLTNDGTYAAAYNVAVTGGDLVNNGVIDGAGTVAVTDGSIVNAGTMNGVESVTTSSSEDFTAGADYSITNSGIMAGPSYVGFSANTNDRGDDAKNDTTGSFTNTGTLQLAGLQVAAHDDIILGGALQVGIDQGGDTKYVAVSVDHPLFGISMQAANGTLTVSSPIAFAFSAMLSGQQVKLMADVTGAAVEDSVSSLLVGAGDKLADDYALRIGSGVKVSADMVAIGGVSAGITGDPFGAVSVDVHPNVILQGTLAGNQIFFGGDLNEIQPTGNGRRLPEILSVSDVFSGPNGGVIATGKDAFVGISFTGAIKTAPYLKASNFRYNYLPISAAGGVTLALDPVMYETNGTSNGMSAVNILVDGSVELAGREIPEQAKVSSAVTGVNSWENTHLVLQSTGNITTDGAFYWPGYVYLGTIAVNDGSAAPGTLGLGQIGLGGDFNNVLPGDVSGAGGVHFISQFPLGLDADEGTYSVTTNANSWVNFGTDLLTQGYASGTLGGSFVGGTQGAGNVVNYGELDASMFHTHAPVAAQ